jgi:hypothetical protein
MAKRRASAVPVAAVQSGFHHLGAFRSLMQLMSEAMPDQVRRLPLT